MRICLKNSVAVVLGEKSAEQRNSGKMSLGVQERHNRASMETQSGAKAPPAATLSQSLGPLPPRWPLPTELHGPVLFTLALQKETNIQMKEPFHKKAPPPRPLLSRWLWTVVSSRPSSFAARLGAPSLFQAACYPLDLDTTSTQTSSLCRS